MKDAMTLKELVHYESVLESLQLEYEGKLSKMYGTSKGERERTTIVLDLIVKERHQINNQKYKPV